MIKTILALAAFFISVNVHALSCDWERRDLEKYPNSEKHKAALAKCEEFAAELSAKEEADRAKRAEEVAKAADARKKKGGARIGMTAQQVLSSSWGQPDDIHKTTTAKGIHEQWVYGANSYLYFDNGKLTAIQN